MVNLDGCKLNGWNLCKITRGALTVEYFKLMKNQNITNKNGKVILIRRRMNDYQRRRYCVKLETEET